MKYLTTLTVILLDSEDKQENDSDSDIETETEQEVSLKSDALVGPIGDQRRKTLPVFMSLDSEVNLLYILKKNIGKDLTKVIFRLQGRWANLDDENRRN